ncbi:MAG: ion transporter [Spirochaetota bacterium]
MENKQEANKQQRYREKLYTIIFEADTPAGKTFDVILLWLILISILVVSLESVATLRTQFGTKFRFIEWLLTAIFSLEYILRIYSSPNRWKYIFSFYGAIDLLSITPTYLSLFFAETHYLLTLRSIRLLRTFRVLKLSRFVKESHLLLQALQASIHKITVFFGFMLSLVVVLGSVMYLLEGEKNGFTNIPMSIYWAIVTVTTVGYGDISPKTVAGQMVASITMLLGYSIIAIPTGIVSSEFSKLTGPTSRTCERCYLDKHDKDANYCKRCGEKLPIDTD